MPAILAVALLVMLAGRAGLLNPTLRVGDPAPEIALADLDGNPVVLSQLRGRPVIVNFFASWCLPDCAREFPLLAQALEAHGAAGLAVIGVVYHDRSEAARAFGRQYFASWPLIMDPDNAVARAYGVLGPPETWFVGRDGRIAARQVGAFTAAELDAQLAIILAIPDES